jgi:hypothetical protein
MLARQALHCLSPFCSGYFSGKVSCPDHDPPVYASHSDLNDRCAPPCPAFSVEMGSCELFAQAGPEL